MEAEETEEAGARDRGGVARPAAGRVVALNGSTAKSAEGRFYARQTESGLLVATGSRPCGFADHAEEWTLPQLRDAEQ